MYFFFWLIFIMMDRFLEGDFESYVRQIRKPHVWGGEPELLMCSHVLRMPITVYMYTKGSDSPRIIAEYGQEYGKDNPICVLYDGYGHYDALQPSLERNTDNRRLRYLRLFSRTVSRSSAT
jgi:OTU domain-containing protein 6